VRPGGSDRLLFPNANGEDQVSILPASGGGPLVWFQVRTLYGEAMQTAEVLLNRHRLHSVLRLLARAARQLDELPPMPAVADEAAYRDEVSDRAAEGRYEAERGGVELPEDF
jgi:hypothetical protein